MLGDNDATVRHIDHVAIRVSDLETAIEFYGDVLGMDIEDRDRYGGPDWTSGEEVPYVAAVAGSSRIHMWPTGGEAVDVPTQEHICLVVRSADLDSEEEFASVLDDLRDQGVEVVEGEPKPRTATMGRAWTAYVTDPDGRTVELRMY